MSLETIATDMLALVEALGRPPDAIVGFSIGATSMLRLLTRRSGVTRAFVSIGASYRGDTKRVDQITTGPWPEELRNLRHEVSDDPEHWRQLRHTLATTWAETLDLPSAIEIAVWWRWAWAAARCTILLERAFSLAKDGGLGSVPHAGETSGATSIRSAMGC